VFILSGQNFANYGYLKKSAHLIQLVLSSSRPCEDTFVLGISKGGSYAVIHVCFDDGSERQCVRPDQSFVIIVLIVLERRWCLFDGREMGEREQEFRLLETGTQMPISITLLTYLSKGNACANTEIRVTATFLNQANESICSGVIPYAMTLSAELQIFNLEIRPLTQQDFLRWRNEPGIRGLQQGKPLKCFNVDRDMERARASSVYLSVAVLPPQTGLAVLDAIIRLNP